jgi:hypothetical protein
MSEVTGGHARPAQRTLRRAALLAAAVAGLAVLTTACGGASPAGSSPSRPPGYHRYQAYTRCMRAHGAPFWPGPTGLPAGVWDNPLTYAITTRILAQEHGPGWQAALATCRKLAPQALPYTAAQVSALRSRLQKLATCMRAHGIAHFPSPTAGPYGAGFASLGSRVSTDSAQFLAAQRACWAYAPGS